MSTTNPPSSTECPQCGLVLGPLDSKCTRCGLERVETPPRQSLRNLRPCPTCGQLISVEATACPKCGHPIKTAATANRSLVLHPSQIAAFVGAAILLVGVFCPIVTAPMLGSMVYVTNGFGNGVVVIALTVAAVIFTICNNMQHNVIFGSTALGMVVFDMFRVGNIIQQMEASLRTAGSTAADDIANAATYSVNLQWGWAIMIIGSVILTASTFIKGRNEVSEGNH